MIVGLSVLLLGASALAGVSTSGADFTHTTQTGAVVTADADWTPPSVAVVDPGFVVSGSVELTATASDGQTTVATVEIQYRAQGATDWTSICVNPVSPWSCTWATTSVADGVYELRAIATDVEANVKTSAIVTTEVYNTAGVVIDPVPSPTRGIVVLTARVVNAAGATTITFQGAVAGSGNWMNLQGCSGPGPEASCSYDTTTAPSGTYDLRAVGVTSTNTYYDVQPNIVVDNTAPSVALTVPAGPLSGSVELTATATDALTGVSAVTFEHRLSGSGGWTTCGNDAAAPYACQVNTVALVEGTHEFRATAADAAGNTTTTAIQSRVVDNQAPALELTVPGGPLLGTVNLTATATDAGSGVASVAFQYRVHGAAGWSICGTDASSPFACSFDTAAVANGTYEFRAVATDVAGRTTTAPIQTRAISNAVASVSITSPAAGTTIYGSTTVSASASSTAGVTSVALQYRPSGGGWAAICSRSAAPYSCSWGTAALAYGSYELRAVMTQGNGVLMSSAAVAVTVPQPGGYDVQGTAAPNGVLDMGDTITLQYNDAMNLSTLAPSWTGLAPYTTFVTLTDNTLDTLTFPSGVNLGSVTFTQNYIDAGKSHTFNATLTAGTATVNGVTTTTIVVTVGSRTTGGKSWLLSATGSGQMGWTPSALAKDAAGNASSVTPVAESGIPDADL